MYDYFFTPDDDVFRNRLRKSRDRKDMTLEELANKTTVTKGTLSKYESGSITRIKMDVLYQIAVALSVNPDYLMGKTDDPYISDDDLEDWDVLYGEGEDVYRYTSREDSEKTLELSVLGMCLAQVATDEVVRQFVVELSKMSEEKRALALKMIKALQ